MIGSPDPARQRWRWVPRVLLFVPKWAFIVVTSPLRLAAWAYNHYHLEDAFIDIFFTDDRRIGLYPTLFFETGFGLSAGARFVFDDALGAGERVRAGALFAGRYQQRYYGDIDSGDRLGRIRLALEMEHERRPRDRFFGIGNADQTDPTGVPVDPTATDIAVTSRFRQKITRLAARSSVILTDAWTLHPRVALIYRSFDTSESFDERDVANNYDLSSLTGFQDGTSNIYGEVELRYDTRRHASNWDRRAINGTGWLLSGFAGWQEGFGDDPSSFLRYGGDVQRYINLYHGDRILALRLFLDAVGGDDATLDQVPFVDLPRLGGPEILRGYARDRFRDRIAAMASATYTWGLGSYLSAFLFADLGRTYHVWEDLGDTTLSSLRLGFGGGFVVHSHESFVARAHLASSIDGEAFLILGFSPFAEPLDRLGRP